MTVQTDRRDEIVDFLYNEARMLDEARYNDWLALWLETGHYWMPLDFKQTDPHLVTSFLYEDYFMIRLRIERLDGVRTFSQKPKSRCLHVLNRPFIDEADDEAGTYKTVTAMHYLETRLDDQLLLGVTATHDLQVVDGVLRIANKRVDLVNCDAAFPNIQLLP
ncbi:MAG: nuclear transport factor 2 family protein [Marinibacterium sp.]|nr:nuclear transport factor 2 family protein [Marinibacterium sp.]